MDFASTASDCPQQPSPLQRIPVELLSEIFISCLDTKFARPDLCEPPLLLTLVCGRWRRCATNTARLWSSLMVGDGSYWANVNDPDARVKRLLSQVAIMKTWFGRSGTLPLSLSIQVNTELCEETQSCMQMLRSYFPRRILRLTINLCSARWLLVLSGVQCPVLDELEVTCYASLEHPLSEPLHAPFLRKLTLANTVDWATAGLVFAPWRLRELDWRNDGEADTLFEMLWRCYSSSQRLITGRDKSSLTSEIIILPSLEQLDLRSSCSADWRPLLHKLRLSGLRRMILNTSDFWRYGNGITDAQSIVASLSYSSPHLTFLSVRFQDPICEDAAEFRMLLKTTPRLEVLRLYAYRCNICRLASETREIFASLTYDHVTGGYQSLLPNLSELMIACQCNQDVCPSMLDVETMLRSRVGSEGATSRARLRFVRISLNAVPSQWCARWHDLHSGWIIRDLHDGRAGTISHRTKMDLTKDCKSRPTGWIGGLKPPSQLARLTKWIVRKGRNFRQVLSRTTR
ncbi:hypothetical protein NEOLEDRAFT_1096547 [Neolentinus lepideus HHB14362 ss-1]|uniref:Uncharacterized protein n=1 Tax=Neolentinus lepideus HHB14362 ss-1 TaxID=1314782 RepID=A0A165QZT1_9AGAM|nr:hypothetical protein NEOLEDRAFT_1096547 [Neolentinus lepideus HHB14362 ss-1]